MKLYAVFFLLCLLASFPMQANGSPMPIELRSVIDFHLHAETPAVDADDGTDSDDDDTLFSTKNQTSYNFAELLMLIVKACSPAAWMDSTR